MASRRGLGMNITSDMVRDYFSPKPVGGPGNQQQLAAPIKYEKHHVGGTSGTTRAASGIATPHFSREEVRYYEQRMTLSGEVDEDDEFFEQEAVPISEMLLPEPDDTAPNPQQQQISTEVYDNYSFEHNYDETLPITDERKNLIQTIESNRVTIIQGSTGSGKTTQVPQYILDYYRCSQKYCNILVTQPRRIAAISVAKRVSQERNWPVGTLVGYQVARDRNVSEDTRITYMTTGVLLQKLIKNKSIGEYTHVLLDEVHERDQNIDFCMLVVRKFLRNVSRHVKVVLMSATVDCSLFSNYFSILINGMQAGAPIISVEGKMFDVDEYYFEDISGLSEIPQQNIMEPHIGDKCYRLCRELIMVLDKDEVQSAQSAGPMLEKRGAVLCFLPGLPEIKEMKKYLADIEESKRLRVIPLHSSITTSEQNQVFITAGPYERKVILSTNIAESSITVPDIKYVIDFCLTKQNEVDPDTNYQRLTLRWASRASLTQRKGRAGRVSDGHCFRMISARMVDDLDDYCTPEMKRAPLEQIVLQVKLLELGPPAMILQLALEPPSTSDVKRTILMLKEVGALTVKQGDRLNPLDGDLTFVGRVLGTLPVDVYIGKLLLIGYAFGMLEECIVIGACLSLKSMFMQPFRQELKAYSNKMHWAKFSGSDLIASYNAFLSWKFRKEHKGFGMPENVWARNNMVEARRFRDIDELSKELRDRLYSFNILAPRNIFKKEGLNKDDELVLKLVIAGAFYPNYFQTAEIDEAGAAKEMSGQNPFTCAQVSGAPPTLCHYRSKVAQLFRHCGRGRRMFFENSRTIIEFENDNYGDSPVAVALYKAMKMRQLRMPLSIFVSKKRDEDLRHELFENPLEAINPETGLKTNRINTTFNDKEGKFSVTMAGNSKRVEVKDSGYLTIFVQEIVHPGQFWATFADRDTRTLMYQLHQKINSLEGRNLKPLDRKDICVGSYCLALFEDEFHRAEIKLCTPDGVQVLFLDYGNKAVVSTKHLKFCSDALLETPFQAFLCELSEIRPIHGTWTEDSHLRFKELVPIGSKEFIGKVYSCVHDVCRLELFDDDESINRMLIEEGHAQFQDENLMSKNKHESAKIKKKSEGAGHIIPEASDVRGDEEVLKITLRGPYSPYELSFGGLTASARMRAVGVGQDSVNSVVMCEEPQEKRQRLMVAASIAINTQGTAITARETTLFPNIHGLKCLLPLFFAPVAELRCDKNQTKYTGALCGLGYTDNGTAILPDHDIEVLFDVVFKDEDWIAINWLRHFINMMIGIEEERIDRAHKMIEELQQHARNYLIKIVTAHREDMEPVRFKKEFQWNQNDPSLLLDPEEHKSLQAKPCHLYMYHKGIFFPEENIELDPRIAEQRKQIENLHTLSGDSLIPFKSEVVCPLCQIVCRHPRAVHFHTETTQHQNWLKSLFQT